MSTQEQNRSGLGLSAQDSDIEYKIKQLKSKSKYKNVEVLDTFAQIESRSSIALRPKLIYAIAKCKEKGAHLLVQKIERLSSNIQDVVIILKKLKKNVLFADLNTNNSMEINFILAKIQMKKNLCLKIKKEMYKLC